MNTNRLKKFAQESRKKLMNEVSTKLNYVLNSDSAELREKSSSISKLREELKVTTKEQLIEKVSYTWFNRLIALRFMDVNDYQPLGVKILTPLDGFTTPEILDESKRGIISDEIQVDRKKISDLLDGRLPSPNPQNEVYKLLLIGACNHLHKTFPFLFERIDDYTDLLLPDDLTSEFSIIQDIRDGMSKEDCKEVEIIGWLYQFYISEKKDEVFASNEKVKKEDIPAATQLFTPRWIVEYMVQNTVGKLWMLNNPSSRLKEHMPYYIESEERDEDYLRVSSVEEMTLLDQACGSGHILVYGFELFAKIYEEQGYSQSEIPELIITKNLFGFEIDERASQLSGFALLMKAREYHRRVFRKELKPNILCYRDLKLTEDEIKETFHQLKIELTNELLFDLKNIQQSTNLGSLISPHTDPNYLKSVSEKIESLKNTSDFFFRHGLEELEESINQLISLSRKYHCVVDNPPYMGGGKMNKQLSDWVKTNYPNSKSDLMACFMEVGLNILYPKGFMGMINQHSWMFLSSYEGLRNQLLKGTHIDTLLHLGSRTFPEIGGEVVQNSAFTLKNDKSSHKGKYFRLVDFDSSAKKKLKTLEAINNPECGWFFRSNQNDFSKIPGSPIGYWLSSKVIEIFDKEDTLKDFADVKQGLATSDNNRFRRNWSEIEFDKSSIQNGDKWFPYNSGGEFRKWYGNQNYLVNWENDGDEIKTFVKSVTRNTQYYFKPSISWSKISSSDLSMRYFPEGFIFDVAGCSIFTEDQNFLRYYLGSFNSKISKKLLQELSPTLNFEVGQVSNYPASNKLPRSEKIIDLVNDCVHIARLDWDKNEYSFDFKSNGMIPKINCEIEESFDLYKQYWTNKFFQLHKNEEELNRQFIEIYGLQDEITHDVPLEEITILKEETSIVNGELIFNQKEVLDQFISYVVGCMFGRYSLDKEGLILANQGETLQDYLSKIEKQEAEISFLPDEDNIIPILDDEWFEDDIVGRFHEFLRASFGDQNFEKNLTFVEESIGKDIRKYFVKDFYKDHIQRYKKRPVYWMFSSPKGSFNVLIYMHRYTPDTLNQILNGYLNEYREKLKSRVEELDHLMNRGSSSEQIKASKEKDKLRIILLELQEYERDILYPLATERISIDLDDGVLVNYNKFGEAMSPVSGLNDSKTKKKVREFDWIDTTTIR
jgi:type II restriction/modification system DNA methylase subunit YeeA